MQLPSRPFRRTAPRRPGAVSGFSLIELLVTIAIAAIIAGLAAPSFKRMINGNRIQTAASALQGDLMYARAEAVKRGIFVSVCPSSDSATCLTSNSWQSGWIVFFDKAGNGVFDPSVDTILKVRGVTPGSNTIVGPATPNAVVFNREGFTTNLGTTTAAFTFHTSDNFANSTRCVLVNFGGGLSTVPKGTTCL